jgi:hypothetical protein
LRVITRSLTVAALKEIRTLPLFFMNNPGYSVFEEATSLLQVGKSQGI